jgi:hypothetical protein
MSSPQQVSKPFPAWGAAGKAHPLAQESLLAAGWFIDQDFLIRMYRFRGYSSIARRETVYEIRNTVLLAQASFCSNEASRRCVRAGGDQAAL